MDQKGVSLRVAVYDDNSSDDTHLLKSRYPDVSWEFGKVNKGYVYARNKFMSEATEHFFCSLDDDSWFINNDSLAKAVHYLDATPGVAAVAFDIISPDHPTHVEEREPEEVSSFIGCGHVLRLSNVRQVGFYDPPPSYYGGEEKDLCIRLIDKGYRIMKLPGVHVWHDKTMVARDFQAQHRSGICNDMVFAWRRAPFVFLIPAMILKPVSHLRFALRYEKGILLRACFAGLKDFYARLLRRKIGRRPVSIGAFGKFMKLNK
jgi:GT2 family glycosyltransferase